MAVTAKKAAPVKAAPRAEPAPPPPMEHNKPPQEMRIQAPAGRAVAVGRDGKPIWRYSGAGNNIDPYAVDPSLVPPGWVYEWKRYMVKGEVDHTYQAHIRRVGRWEPVQASAHPGVWTTPEHTGDIIVDGLILMERPEALHREAQRDEKFAADQAMLRARAERGLAVPGGTVGVSTQTPEARGASYVNTTRAFQNAEDRAALESIQKPAYNYDRDTID